jgi:hypothetical protein
MLPNFHLASLLGSTVPFLFAAGGLGHKTDCKLVRGIDMAVRQKQNCTPQMTFTDTCMG